MKPKPEHEKLSAYYNLNNGTGTIRGVYLQGNATVKDIFQSWLTPFADLGAKTITIKTQVVQITKLMTVLVYRVSSLFKIQWITIHVPIILTKILLIV